jgi:putative resolvase
VQKKSIEVAFADAGREGEVKHYGAVDEDMDSLGREVRKLVSINKDLHRKLVIIDQGELNDDLAQGMVDILTSFRARLYGRRSAANWAKKAVEAAGR